jgi:hypothetical protein
MTISANYPNLATSLNLDFANSRALDPRVSFSRPTTAAYYDNHTTALAEQNLLTYSQDYTNAIWQKQNANITANSTTAPDGTATASTLTANASTNYHIINVQGTYVGTTAGTYTLSQYFKAGTSNFVSLGAFVNASAWINVTANLSTVAITQTSVGTTFTSISSSITASTNGFYRVTVTFSTIGTSGFLPCFQINSSATPTLGSFGLETWTAVGTETIFLWGSQAEARSTVTAYTPTTTTAITNYIPVLLTAVANDARFDCNPVTRESLGLLIEQQSTNLALYSSDFSNAAWTSAASNVTLNSNTIVAPDGTLTGDTLVSTVTNGNHFLRQDISGLTNAATYTVSIFAKAGGYNRFDLLGGFSSATGGAAFDLSTGTVTSGTGQISAVGNGWYRCSTQLVMSGTVLYLLVRGLTNAGAASYAGDGYSGVYIWGAQLEALSFSTSYIPTVASQVTRSADSASMTGTNFSSWYNNSAGSMYAEFSREVIGVNSQGVFSFNPASGSEFLGVYALGGNDVIYAVTGGVAGSVNTNFGASTLASKKISYALTSGAFRGAYNGTATASATPASVEQGVTTFYIGNVTGASFLSGWIKKLAYYPTAISATNLQAITGS